MFMVCKHEGVIKLYVPTDVRLSKEFCRLFKDYIVPNGSKDDVGRLNPIYHQGRPLEIEDVFYLPLRAECKKCGKYKFMNNTEVQELIKNSAMEDFLRRVLKTGAFPPSN